jgi:aminopeptidase-like protein
MQLTTEKREIEAYFDRLWPLLRSITGDGVRQTHEILRELVPLVTHEYPSGSRVLQWKIPQEWKVRDAYVRTPAGQLILNVWDNNLHLVGYSIPARAKLSREDLDKHLFSIPAMPEAIPYVTSYYKPKWGFCLPHAQREALPPGEYDVVVDTELFDGSLTLSDLVIEGSSSDEILFHTYTCHPSLANNELSGPLVTAFLARRIAAMAGLRYTYRFVFAPETIGAIAYLDTHGEDLKKTLKAGYVISCVGDSGASHYKASKRNSSAADRVAEHVLERRFGQRFERHSFSPSGSDERQYCSIGFDLPVGVICRTMFGRYPEYHTSRDNKSLMDFDAMVETVDLLVKICDCHERNRVYVNTQPNGEPQLSKYFDYRTRDMRFADEYTMAAKWCVHYCDGRNDLLEIASLSGIGFQVLADVAERLATAGLFRVIQPGEK